MTLEERKAQIEVIESVVFDRLPDDAIRFLVQYLLASCVDDKLGIVLGEASRLHGRSRSAFGGSVHEHVDFKETT